MTLDEISRIYAKGIAEHVRAGYVIDDMLLQNSVHHLRFKQAIREAIDKGFKETLDEINNLENSNDFKAGFSIGVGWAIGNVKEELGLDHE